MRLWASSTLLALGLVVAFGACGTGSAPSPFGPGEMDAGLDVRPPGDAGAEVFEDPTLGGPCSDDGQCDDGVSCTIDRCDLELGRCRHTPDDAVCADDVYCDGVERCDLRLGCREGEPVSCSDDDSCTIDTCVEATRSCTYRPRDADGDGDPVWNCEGGGDCDDANPRISSQAAEICGNGIDDDCDLEIDEDDCETPAHDTCAKALLVDASGFYELSLTAAELDYPTNCAPAAPWREVVVALSVPEGPALDIDVVATATSGEVSLGSAEPCGEAASQVCSESALKPGGGAVSRLLLRAKEPGAHPLYVASTADGAVTLKVIFRTPEPAPENETCGTAAPLEPGVQVRATLTGLREDATSACGGDAGDLFYTFSLAEPSDVHLYVSAEDDYGLPVISLRDAECKTASDELTCRVGNPQHLFARALAPGQYFVSLSATGPSDASLLLEITEASEAPENEGCLDPPPLVPGETEIITLADHVDAVPLACATGAPDAAYALELDEPSDVLLVALLSDGDTGGLSLTDPSCDAHSALTCVKAAVTPLRTSKYNVPAGSYRAVIESSRGTPVSLTAFTRPAAPPLLAPFADDCSTLIDIPPQGARIQGNTQNAFADFEAGCDIGRPTPGGARDQLLRLVLSEPRRVVLDMRGSQYETLLLLRSGPECPGSEIPLTCAAGYEVDRSFLDVTLEAGEYFVQVDGYDGEAGPWTLDVYTAPP